MRHKKPDFGVQTTLEQFLPRPSFSASAVAANQTEVGGKQLKEEAIERGWTHAGDGWRAEATKALRLICETRETFTADDLDEVMRRAREPRAVGGLLQSGQSRGWCVPTDEFVPSALARRHGRRIPTWRSLLLPPHP
jgi:hypothetical protein